MNKEINREAWLLERRTGIGGSDIAAIVGLSKWDSPLDIFLDKTGQKPPKEENEAMRLGSFMEPYIVKRYEEVTGFKCVEQEGMKHDGCFIANVDRIVDVGDGKTQIGSEIVSKRILECKTARFEWEDGVPLMYQCQVQWYMGLFPEVKECDVAVYYTGGQKEPFHIFNVKRDDEIIAKLHKEAKEFWVNYVVPGVMPPASNQDDAKFIWARHKEGEHRKADKKTLDALHNLRTVNEKIDNLEEEKARLITDIMKFMGEAECLDDANGKTVATWKNNKDSVRTDWQAVSVALHASKDVIKLYTTVKPGSRIFRLK